jgi:hypothetical protein
MNARSGIVYGLHALALATFAGTAAAIPIGNIVKNAGFESGGLPPWHTSGATGSAARTNAAATGAIGIDQDSAHTGQFGVFASATGGKVFLAQTLQTVKGSSYILSFWLDANQTDAVSAAAARGNPVDFEVFWNGKLIYDNSDIPTSYTKFTFSDLVATSRSTVLKFGFRDDSGFFHLDDVVVGIRVPEAFSTLWLALPLVTLLGLRKKLRTL